MRNHLIHRLAEEQRVEFEATLENYRRANGEAARFAFSCSSFSVWGVLLLFEYNPWKMESKPG